MLAEDKNVIVTGGGSGIGRAIAETFVREGAHVFACDINAALVREADAGNSGIRVVEADVGSERDVDRLFDAALEHFDGRLDVLVNNAGVGGPTGGIETLQLEDWKATFEVNVHSAFLCLRRAVPVMKRAGSGVILQISSTAGFLGYPLRTPYAAAKWAINGLTKSLAMELGPSGIRVNAICPGSVEGPRMDRVIRSEAAALGVEESEVRRGYVRQVSMRTFIEAQDIGEAAVFLCSDRASKVSGQILSVDGHNETLTTIEL
jgi:NAD(P)-dependent dehydrogenase (short-subunit alcohol dehydrogenase family)